MSNSIQCPLHRRWLSPQGAPNPGGTEASLGAALHGWNHSALSSQPASLPKCPRPRRGEGSRLPCERELPNSPFITEAAKAAEANRLPPLILNCKINFKRLRSSLLYWQILNFMLQWPWRATAVGSLLIQASLFFWCQSHILDSSGFTN